MDGGDKRESPDSSAQSKSPRTLRNSMHGNRETSGASAPETAADRREKAQSQGEEGRPRIKENASPTHTSPAQNGERVSQGLAGVRQAALTPRIQDRSRMREIRSYGSVRGALGDQSPYRDRHLWGSLASCAPMASALFESRKVSDFGNGTVRQK